eukprot:CAMPEP_0119122648 /NCGR_PEP_ID=MMETSP1310-20130426/2840_1 /TAXON_ID=464262 /ORGANISM="Genus nov. species nov., Strain RCC2339" /LENGTH=177 /DNA_ID=CAMNT_0007112337 /DNA_START=70 /DNA_END=603 /DNA_ORIENTATION=-
MGTTLKFRYGQTSDATRRSAYVRNWQVVEGRKRALKHIVKQALGIPPAPPRLPPSHSGRANALQISGDKESAPVPPPLPAWTRPLMLRAVRATLRPLPGDSAIPSPPPLPMWVLAMSSTSLRPVDGRKPPTSPPRPNQGLLEKSPVFLRVAKKTLQPVPFPLDDAVDVPHLALPQNA